MCIRDSDYTNALTELKQAEEMNPELPEVNSYYAQALFASGETEASRKIFEKELARNPNDFQSNVHLGLMLRQEEKYDEAMKYLKTALASRPGDVAVRYQIALVKMAQGKDDPARDELERIVAEAPTFTEAHVSLSIIYFRQKRKEDGNRERAIVQKLNAERQSEQQMCIRDSHALGQHVAAPSARRLEHQREHQTVCQLQRSARSEP